MKRTILLFTFISALPIAFIYTYGSGKVAGFNEGIRSAIEYGVSK